MTQWITIYLIVLLSTIILTAIFIPDIISIAFRRKLFDEINQRKIHTGDIPRLGGVVVFPIVMASMLLVFGLVLRYLPASYIESTRDDLSSLCIVGTATIILYFSGLADDLTGLRYRQKFCAQIVGAALVVASGVYIDDFHGFLGINAIPYPVASAITMVLIVFITNAINLIDGIDGLASGLSALACVFFSYILFYSGIYAYALLAVATFGTLLPLFYYNVFGDAKKHTKIFLGDTGTQSVGIILSVLAIRVCMTKDTSVNYNPAVLGFAPLMIPCLDVVRVYLLRIMAHRNPFLPDKTHIHHQLLALGLSQRASMLSIILAALLLTATNYWLCTSISINILFASDCIIWIVGNMALARAIRHRALAPDRQ